MLLEKKRTKKRKSAPEKVLEKIEISEMCGGEKKRKKEKKRNVWRKKRDKGKIKNPN